MARWNEGRLESLLRKRAYIRLAQDFESPQGRTLKQAGIERALRSLEAFRSDMEHYQAKRSRAVATGVVRAAENRNLFTDLVREKTGIQVRVVPGGTGKARGMALTSGEVELVAHTELNAWPQQDRWSS